MFSGGLDSTGALWTLLKNTKYKLHLHHLHLVNPTKRAKVEQAAVKNILSYIGQRYSSIIYSESYHEYTSYSYFTKTEGTNRAILNENLISDSDIYNFMAGTISMCLPHIKRVAIGRTKSDDNPLIIDRATRGSELLKLFAPNVQKIYPVEHLTKEEIYNMLPEELRDLTWSCRTPVIIDDNFAEECGECKTCLELKKIRQS